MNWHLIFLLFFFPVSSLIAHPVAQGAMEIIVHPERVEIRARVSVEEAFVAEGFSKDAPAESTEAIWQRHGAYLTKHVFVDADGKRLTGRVISIMPPVAPITTAQIGYEMEYALLPGTIPKSVTVSQAVLNKFEYAIGNPWEATFVTTVSQSGGMPQSGLLFTRKAPINFTCDWTTVKDPAGGTRIDHGRLFSDYTRHGIMHILTGYDHLLFMAGLVLAVNSLLDLAKVVVTFTLAHTATLTLSVLGIIRLPSNMVEPIIAASIVFVAAQNMFFPVQSRGWTRLLVTFGFGLFHGLGFAGGLLEAMEGLPGLAVTAAIVAFSLGVEIGHQAVVIPFYFGLKPIRGNPDATTRYPIQRYASIVVFFAGMYYLVAALR